MTPDPTRCSSVSRAIGEPQSATASTVTRWVLLEQPGPWGANPLRESRLPRAFAGALVRRTRRLGVRVILIRRPGRSSPEGAECFLAWTGEEPWLERGRLHDLSSLLDADLEALARGERTGFGEPDPDPLFLVCTNGRRDPCCAERGRPVARALEDAFGRRAWECSHIGGDRFAGNVVCFPHGMYFGRVEPEEAVALAERYRRGEIDLEHYRGRTVHPMPVQAAEHAVRARLGLVGVDDLRLEHVARQADGRIAVTFGTSEGGRASVVVRVGTAPPRRLTCHAVDAIAPPAYAVDEAG